LPSAKPIPEKSREPAPKIVEGRHDIVESMADELIQRKSCEPQNS